MGLWWHVGCDDDLVLSHVVFWLIGNQGEPTFYVVRRDWVATNRHSVADLCRGNTPASHAGRALQERVGNLLLVDTHNTFGRPIVDDRSCNWLADVGLHALATRWSRYASTKNNRQNSYSNPAHLGVLDLTRKATGT